MSNYYKALVIVPLVVLVGLGALYFFLNSSSTSSTYQNKLNTVPADSSDSVGDITKVEVGTEQISSDSVFKSVEGGFIIYTEKGASKTTKTPSDEMAILCTKQNLDGLTQLDFDNTGVQSVKVVKPSEVNGIIASGTTVVVLANQADGEFIAHSLVVGDLGPCR